MCSVSEDDKSQSGLYVEWLSESNYEILQLDKLFTIFNSTINLRCLVLHKGLNMVVACEVRTGQLDSDQLSGTVGFIVVYEQVQLVMYLL